MSTPKPHRVICEYASDARPYDASPVHGDAFGFAAIQYYFCDIIPASPRCARRAIGRMAGLYYRLMAAEHGSSSYLRFSTAHQLYECGSRVIANRFRIDTYAKAAHERARK